MTALEQEKLTLWHELLESQRKMVRYLAEIEGKNDQEIAQTISVNTQQVEAVKKQLTS
jgi:DNA-directed RNA polymerase specialized sigma24 family protein